VLDAPYWMMDPPQDQPYDDTQWGQSQYAAPAHDLTGYASPAPGAPHAQYQQPSHPPLHNVDRLLSDDMYRRALRARHGCAAVPPLGELVSKPALMTPEERDYVTCQWRVAGGAWRSRLMDDADDFLRYQPRNQNTVGASLSTVARLTRTPRVMTPSVYTARPQSHASDYGGFADMRRRSAPRSDLRAPAVSLGHGGESPAPVLMAAPPTRMPPRGDSRQPMTPVLRSAVMTPQLAEASRRWPTGYTVSRTAAGESAARSANYWVGEPPPNRDTPAGGLPVPVADMGGSAVVLGHDAGRRAAAAAARRSASPHIDGGLSQNGADVRADNRRNTPAGSDGSSWSQVARSYRSRSPSDAGRVDDDNMAAAAAALGALASRPGSRASAAPDPASRYVCGACGKGYGTTPGLKRHYAEKHGAVHACEHCDAGFETPKDLKRHVDARHKIPAVIYRCRGLGCGYYSQRKDVALRHARVTHGVSGEASGSQEELDALLTVEPTSAPEISSEVAAARVLRSRRNHPVVMDDGDE